jgi:alcohol dehydrogenase (cytochrome c)
VQNGAGDGGTRGWVAALDVNSGKELWRWYTVPKPGDPGSETWKDDHNAWKTGGGGIWQTGSYDAAQNLYIVGTGNPFPIYDPQFRPGDNLYTNSVVALDVATGKMAWYFQYTPNDSWDYDETGAFLLYDTTINRSPAQGGRPLRRATASSIRSTAPTAASSRPKSTSTI